MAARFDLVVHNGTLVSTSAMRRADVAVRHGRVAAIEPAGRLAEATAAHIDATGLLVLPGLIDAHVHFRAPGLEHEEDWESGTRAAVFGGVTTVLDMPNTVPPTAGVELATAKLALADARAYCDFGLFGLTSDDAAPLEALVGSGLVVGLKAFLGPTTGGLVPPTDRSLRAALQLASAAQGMRVVFHAEDAGVVAAATAEIRAAGRDHPLAHLLSRPAEAEVAAIDRIGSLLLRAGGAGHIAHVTSAAGLRAIERWQARGADLTCEVTPHHALLDVDVYSRFGGLAKVNPPIRGEPDASALLDALAGGRIDMVASDHAPHVAADKARGSVWDVPAGIAGVETLLPLLLTEVAAGRLDAPTLVRVTSEAPAKAFGLWPRKGSLELGADADIILVEPGRAGVIRAASLHGKNDQTPFEGRSTVGAVVTTIVRGAVAVRDGELLGQTGWGRAVRRT